VAFDLDQVLQEQGLTASVVPETWDEVQTDLEENARRRGFVMVGLGVLGGVTVLGALGWMIQRQLVQGDVFRLRLEHALEDDDRKILEELLPNVRKVASQGVGLRLSSRAERRLASRRASIELEGLSQDE
tara:strand:- start:4426 stop:4815 length:390 start_codon:yes stop_codon:yes gene_type:complete